MKFKRGDKVRIKEVFRHLYEALESKLNDTSSVFTIKEHGTNCTNYMCECDNGEFKLVMLLMGDYIELYSDIKFSDEVINKAVEQGEKMYNDIF